jgi:cation:H+ antiporter
MEIVLAIAAFIVGVAIIVLGSDFFIKGLVSLSLLIGIPVLVATVFTTGFDVENLTVGISAQRRGLTGIALGTIIGSATLMCAAMGMLAIVHPFRIRIPKLTCFLPLAFFGPLFYCISDANIDIKDAILLLVAFPIFLFVLILFLKPGFVQDEEVKKRPIPQSILFLLLGVIILVVGGEIACYGAKNIVRIFNLHETIFGMTIVAIAVTLEEIGIMIAAARAGRPEIAMSDVAATMLYYATFNTAIISLTKLPLYLDWLTISFHLPAMAIILLLTGLFVATGRTFARPEGIIIVLLYIAYLILNPFSPQLF